MATSLNGLTPNTVMRFDVWQPNARYRIPCDDSKFHKPHMYVVFAGDGQALDKMGARFTCLPISSERLNSFSVLLPRYPHDEFLKHDSYIWCDFPVTLLRKQLDVYLGSIADIRIHQQVEAMVGGYLGL